MSKGSTPPFTKEEMAAELREILMNIKPVKSRILGDRKRLRRS